MLGVGCWMLDVGSGWWMLDVKCCMFGVGYWKHNPSKYPNFASAHPGKKNLKKEDGNKKNQRQVKKYELKLEILNAQEQGFFMKHRIDNVERANLELLDKVFDKEKTIEN